MNTGVDQMELASKYSYRVLWSPDDGEYVAVCIELPGLSGLGGTQEAAIAEARDAVSGWLAHLEAERSVTTKPR